MIERLVLGTVQLGLNYGINNKHGKPSKIEALKILDKAFEFGIRVFDTAYAYGNAEEILGDWISQNRISNEIKIISKLKPNIFDEVEYKHQIIRNEIYLSLERLKINTLDGYLFHTPSYIYKVEALEWMVNCKKEGIIKNCGVSIYDEKEALYAAEHPFIDYIQIPYNVLDQRLERTVFFNKMKYNNKVIFARSPFIQGLIFMDDRSIPQHLSKAKDYLKSLDAIITKHGITRLEVAMLFSLYNTGNDYIVFGVDTINQLVDIFDVVVQGKRVDECIYLLKQEFGLTDKSIVIPSLWKK